MFALDEKLNPVPPLSVVAPLATPVEVFKVYNVRLVPPAGFPVITCNVVPCLHKVFLVDFFVNPPNIGFGHGVAVALAPEMTMEYKTRSLALKPYKLPLHHSISSGSKSLPRLSNS